MEGRSENRRWYENSRSVSFRDSVLYESFQISIILNQASHIALKVMNAPQKTHLSAANICIYLS
jgi:hypothetical protein